MFQAYAFYFGHRPGGFHDEGGFVALAAMSRRSQPGGVGFDQKPVQRQTGGHIAQRLGLGISQIAGE